MEISFTPLKRRREDFDFVKVDAIDAQPKVKSNVEVLLADLTMMYAGLSNKTNLEEYHVMKRFMESNCTSRRARKGKSTTYSADLILIDLPTNYIVDGVVAGSTWNSWSDELLGATLDIALIVVDDGGWVILFSPPSHDLQVEVHIGRRNFVIHRHQTLRGIERFGRGPGGLNVSLFIA